MHLSELQNVFSSYNWSLRITQKVVRTNSGFTLNGYEPFGLNFALLFYILTNVPLTVVKSIFLYCVNRLV